MKKCRMRNEYVMEILGVANFRCQWRQSVVGSICVTITALSTTMTNGDKADDGSWKIVITKIV